jgi:2-amino-4-hydroxy-6-hydroxymethyldihydropteridine diphosphokinase
MVIVALGSNLGDSARILRQAQERLRAFSGSPLRSSSLWRTSPVDCPPGSPAFLNAIVALTPLAGATPESFLRDLQAVERDFGRQTSPIRNGPRPLDLDLILFGQETRATPVLCLPHPRALERRFVLAPLAELMPELVFPGEFRTVAACLAGLNSQEIVRCEENF